MNIFNVGLLIFSLAFCAFANSKIETSVQSGFEFDTNVLKSFGSFKNDFLSRVHFKNQGEIDLLKKTSLFWDYQGGGKKYFSHDEQDTLIQYAEIKLDQYLRNGVRLILEPNIKFQNERNKLDTQKVDVNEDYVSYHVNARLWIPIHEKITLIPQGSFAYFHFIPNQEFSFLKESGSLLTQINAGSLFFFGLKYGYTQQQFDDSLRKDREHQFSSFVRYQGKPFFSLGYTFEDSNSNLSEFSFNKHHFNFLLSWIFSNENDSALEELIKKDRDSFFSFHLLASLQLRTFPAVYEFANEGQRFLLTGEDDENFNSIALKIGYHFKKKWALEGKYTRYSNELSSIENAFNRSLYYLGARYEF